MEGLQGKLRHLPRAYSSRLIFVAPPFGRLPLYLAFSSGLTVSDFHHLPSVHQTAVPIAVVVQVVVVVVVVETRAVLAVGGVVAGHASVAELVGPELTIGDVVTSDDCPSFLFSVVVRLVVKMSHSLTVQRH